MGSAYQKPYLGSPSGMFPFGVKWLLISNTAIFLFQFILYQGLGVSLNFLKLIPAQTVTGYIWQPFTYMFLHDVHGSGHILWNMVVLFLTGPMLEQHLGTARFLKYYILCGIGAALCVAIVSFGLNAQQTAVIGCSGAIFGILIAIGVLLPNVLFFGIIKAKWFVTIIGVATVVDGIASRNSGVSHVAHLGGMLIGFLVLRFGLLGGSSKSSDPFASVQTLYRNYKLARARKKFEVYMRDNTRH